MMKFIMPTFLFNIERWKWNDDFRVYVSNMGHFKDEHKKPLSVFIDNRGYCKIKTTCGLKAAHRLVMLTWCPIPNAEELTVDHLDHNKRNNAVSNLEWVTETENLERARRDQVCHAPLSEKEIKEEISKNPAKVTDGIKIYDSVAAAVVESYKNTLPEKQKNQSISKNKMTKMKRRLRTAIDNGTKYFGKTWKYVKEE